MDAQRPDARIDARLHGRGAIGGQQNRPRAKTRLTTLLIVHSLLVVLCLAVSFYTFWTSRSGEIIKESRTAPEQDNGIYLQQISMRTGEHLLKFTASWNHQVELVEESQIEVSCTGPYLLHLWVYPTTFKDQGYKGEGNLTVREEHGGDVLASIPMNCSSEHCGLLMEHSIFSLKQGDKISVHFHSNAEHTLNIFNLHLGLHHMLGAQCFSAPTEIAE